MVGYSLHTLSGVQHALLHLPSGAEEEGTMEEEDEESPGGSNVALGQQLTAGRYQHYINGDKI